MSTTSSNAHRLAEDAAAAQYVADLEKSLEDARKERDAAVAACEICAKESGQFQKMHAEAHAELERLRPSVEVVGHVQGCPCAKCARTYPEHEAARKATAAYLDALKAEPPQPIRLVDRDTLSIRDEFAKAAMQALLTAPEKGRGDSLDGLAARAYAVADKMMAERANTPKPRPPAPDDAPYPERHPHAFCDDGNGTCQWYHDAATGRVCGHPEDAHEAKP